MATNDFLALIAEHYGRLRAFAGAFLRERKATVDFLRRSARDLQEAFPRSLGSAGFPAWARRRLAAGLRTPHDPLRRPEILEILADAFERRRDPRPDRQDILDAAIQSLSQDAQPVLTARYENDLPLETVAWRFRTTPETAMGVLARIRRLLLKALHGPAPEALLRPGELLQRHLEGMNGPKEAEELASRLRRDPAVADAFADAALLDADLAEYFGLDPDAPDEGASLAVKLGDRPRRTRRVTRRT